MKLSNIDTFEHSVDAAYSFVLIIEVDSVMWIFCVMS